MQIDTLGKRYGLLPSEVLRRADSFDLYIMDAALTFENYHRKKATDKHHVPDFTNDELKEIWMRNKGHKNVIDN